VPAAPYVLSPGRRFERKIVRPTEDLPVDMSRRIAAARGEREADLVLRGGCVVNVFSAEVERTDVAVDDGVVVGVGEGYRGREEVDVSGRYICPGLIDGHIHLESTQLTVPEFARAVVPRGTTTVVADPHEIANVHGLQGVRYLLDSAQGAPLSLFLAAPSCVPATDLETTGGALDARDLAALYDDPRVIGLGEVMNFPGVLGADQNVLAKIASARGAGLVADGHCPGLSGRDLNAYALARIGSDHESTSAAEATEKLRRGMYVMIREGSAAHNLRDLLPVVNAQNSRRCCLVTDDRGPGDLLREGHIDHALRLAISEGIDPITAIQMATLNTAEWFGLDRRGYGGIAPGCRADLVVFDDLKAPVATQVYVGGRRAAEGGELKVDLPPARTALPHSVRIDWDRFRGLSVTVPEGRHQIRVIEIVPGQIATRHSVAEAQIENGLAVADPDRDLLKLAVVERHRGTGDVGVGFVRGFGLKRGALASSVAHDSHNIIVAGADDDEMLSAVRILESLGGGQVAVADGEPLAQLPLPIAGLMSDRPLQEVAAAAEELHEAARSLGAVVDELFMVLSFLALPVIPVLKLTDRGLVDVERFAFVPLWADEQA
jgi:adenine deaminase